MDLSIIIPTYNRLWSLPEAIDSCPRGHGVEIIVIDDGSSDGTWDWLQSQQDIVTIRQDNYGKAYAVNRGFDISAGRFVKFLDSDDMCIADQVRRQLEFIKQSDADICVSGYIARYELTGREVAHPWIDCGEFLAQQLGEVDSSHYSAYVFRKEFLRDVRHRPEYSTHDDRMFVIECALLQPKVICFNDPTLIHRHHDQGRTQFQIGSASVVGNWQDAQMWRRVVKIMQSRGMLTPRRGAAMSINLWELAQRTAAFNMSEAKAVLSLLKSLNPSFVPPMRGRDRFYRLLGFSIAQRLVNLGRFTRNLVRRARRIWLPA
jgi:glycosyltransferase involved in cell wall biosynthesis